MADLQKSAPAKRSLPFKRTAKQKPPSETTCPVDDDGISLFSQSKNYFPTVIEDQQKRAREKAEKAEQERKERLAREKEEEENKAREAHLRSERRRKALEEEIKESEHGKKRRRYSLLSDDEDDGKQKHGDEADYNDDFTDKISKRKKSSSPFGTESMRDPSASRRSRATERMQAADTMRKSETLVIINSSDDEDDTKIESKNSVTRPRTQSGSSQNKTLYVDKKGKGKADDSDSDLEMWEEEKGNNGGAEKEGEEDPSEFYIRAAMERKRKAEEARLARESSATSEWVKDKSRTPGISDDDRGTPVSVMIAAPSLPEAKVLCCTVRTTQALQIAFDTFKERQKGQTAYPHKIISELVFTWRGDRVYPTTKLETLGIRPRGHDGRLYDNAHSGRATPEGYVGSDKVYFEAWTPEEYEENQQKRERERKRREMGDWWEGDDTANDNDNNSSQAAAATEAEAPQKEEDRIRVIFKARNMPPRNVTLRKHSTVAQMIKAFRRLASIGEDKHIEIRWDGEALDLETTVEEADIADMDSVEVHIR